ncbi:hypothetical protein NQ314_002707 [Rhamnusium bicolor]|uniref:DUF5641 domain-containing protein n=1 Tax=Rhamnusium bicolor TaxID=1586634 RepID=A0AAV8ZP31_9CUCU|nr:hypothetical protein NQ314_002707 [Rhamnusium bicolor]
MWELEDFTPPVPTSEDSICENYFVENVSRNSFGRYEVALPFKADPTHLGDSFALSQTRLPDIKNAVTVHTQLVKLFENGGFQMVKWMSNSNELLSQIPDFLQLNTPIAFDKESLKVLGLEWNPSSDNFSFKISVSVSPCTKRNMLSLVAQYKLLSENKPLKSNFLRKLNPFIKDHVIRVGGRLSNANVAFDHKHPILLPKSDPFVNLLIDYNHKKYCHTGTHLLQSLLQQNYWIIAARGIIRQRIWKCNHCFRLNPKPNYPIMSDLPSERIQWYNIIGNVGILNTFPHSKPDKKWNTPTNPAQIGMIVVIIQNNIPPLQWPLAIIEKLYPGKDGISRVALVRTKNSSYTRPVAKLCPLPNQS